MFCIVRQTLKQVAHATPPCGLFTMSSVAASPSGIKTRKSSWLDAMSKRPKSVLITGCDTGIGKVTAIRLANKGWRVFAGVLSEAAAKDIQQHNASIVPLVGLDVTNQESVDKAVAKVRDAVADDGLQGLVNNAGIASSIPLEFIPMELFDRVMQVNLYGALRMCQACLPLLRQGKVKGRIVNIGSVLGSAPGPLVGGYSPSKSALESMTTTLRLELKKQGIHVCILKPAVIRTNIYKEALAVTAKTREGLPEEAETLYGPLMDQGVAYIKHIGSNSRGVSPNVVAHVVNKALKDTWPSASYPAGIESRALLFARWYLPDFLMDKATLWEMRMR